MARYDRQWILWLMVVTACPTGASEDGAGTSDSTGGACPEACATPTVLADGIVRCADGSIDRVTPGSFDPTIVGQICRGDEDARRCTIDADCSEATRGRCLHGQVYDPLTEHPDSYCTCAYSCANDSECAKGYACLPPGVVAGTPAWPVCVRATCTSNAECGECGECGVSAFDDGCTITYKLACRTKDDKCRTDADCGFERECTPFGALTWICRERCCDLCLPRHSWGVPLG